MRLMVTIQVVKNGYLVSYPKLSNMFQEVTHELRRYVPFTEPVPAPTFMPSVEEHRIVLDEMELVEILRSLKESLK